MFDGGIEPNSNHGNLAFHLIGIIIYAAMALIQANICCNIVSTLFENIFSTWIILRTNYYFIIQARTKFITSFYALTDTFDACLAPIGIKLDVNAVNRSAALIIDADPSLIQRVCQLEIVIAEFILKMCHAIGTASNFIYIDGSGLQFGGFGENKNNKNVKIITNNSGCNNINNKCSCNNKHDDTNDDSNKSILCNQSLTKSLYLMSPYANTKTMEIILTTLQLLKYFDVNHDSSQKTIVAISNHDVGDGDDNEKTEMNDRSNEAETKMTENIQVNIIALETSDLAVICLEYMRVIHDDNTNDSDSQKIQLFLQFIIYCCTTTGAVRVVFNGFKFCHVSFVCSATMRIHVFYAVSHLFRDLECDTYNWYYTTYKSSKRIHYLDDMRNIHIIILIMTRSLMLSNMQTNTVIILLIYL